VAAEEEGAAQGEGPGMNGERVSQLRKMRHELSMLLSAIEAGLVDLLIEHGSMSVAQIAASLHVTQQAASQRMLKLLDCGLVRRETKRSQNYYRLSDKAWRLIDGRS
jgi:predicted ArsR family transcriptional regulator